MKKLTIFLGLLFSAVFLWLAIRDTNIDQIGEAFANANLFAAIPLLAALTSFYWLKAVRWSDLLTATKEIKAQALVPSMMIGAAGNNLLPAHLGEFIRVFVLAREQKVAKSSVLATLIVERLLDIISVLILLALAVGLTDLTDELRIAGIFLVAVAALVIGFSILILLYTDTCVRILSKALSFLPPGLNEKITAQVQHLVAGLESLRSTHLYVRVILNSIVQWLLMATCIFVALTAFDISVPPQTSIVILGLIVAGLSLPTSPGFVGTIEFCFVIGLQAFDVDASLSLSAAVFYHTVLWISVTFSGMYFMRKHHLSLRQLQDIKSSSDGPASQEES